MRHTASAFNIAHGNSYNRVERRGGRIGFVIDDSGFPYASDADRGVLRTMLEGILIFLHAMLSIYADRDLDTSLVTVRTRRRGASTPDGMRDFWTVPVRGASRTYAIEYCAEIAKWPGNGPASLRASEVYERVLTMITTREQVRPSIDIRERVAAALLDGATTQIAIARALGVSTATLRRLLSGGQSFQNLRDQLLNEQATALLREGRHYASVAEQLGYADARSFSRAFKRWNGDTPASQFNRRTSRNSARPSSSLSVFVLRF